MIYPMYHKLFSRRPDPRAPCSASKHHYMTPFPNMHGLLFRLDDLVFSDHVYRECPDSPTWIWNANVKKPRRLPMPNRAIFHAALHL